MQTVQTPIALTQIGIRQHVCNECDRRPAGSEAMPGEQPRACERGCAVFLLLPRICDLVDRHAAEPPCGYGFAVRSLLRHATEAGAVDGAGHAGSVPLDDHAEATIAVVEQVLRGSRDARRAS